MEAIHHAIFEKAMHSMNPDAILEVAQCFQDLENENGQDENTDENHDAANREPNKFNEYRELADALYVRISILEQPIRTSPTFGFGAMQRGTPVKGTNGAVIPPGRYWIDIPDSHLKAWIDLLNAKHEITVEKSELSVAPGAAVHTIIFHIDPKASNYGLSGVFFPTQVLGFPTIADASIQSKADTIQRPPPMTHMEALQAVPGIFARGAQDAVQYVAETAGKAAGSAASGVGQGLGLTTNQMIGIGVAALFGLFLISRLSTAIVPVAAKALA